VSDAALNLLAALALEDGRRWGEAAVDVQWEDAKAVLDQESVTPNHWLGRARGFSKTTDSAGVGLVAMLAQAPERARLYGIAADQAQGTLLVDAIGGFVARTPELRNAVVVQEFKVIATRTGASLTILPADSSSVWGLRPWLVVVDELTQWHETPRTLRVWEGVTTGLAKVKGSRLAVLGTAGSPGHFSYGIRNQALDDPLWRVHEVEGPPPWMDKQRLAGEKRRLPESSYRRLFENEWTASEDRLANEDDLAACVTLDGPLEPRPGIRYVVTVDLGLKRDATAVAICHDEPVSGTNQRRVVLDRMETWQGSRLRSVQLSTVEAWVEEASRRYNRARVRFDPWQAAGMAQRLKARGISVEEFTFSSASVGKLAVTLLQLIRERSLSLPDDPELLDELRNVRLRESSPGVFRLDHDRNRHDDRAVALALACTALIERPPVEPACWSSALLQRRGTPLSSPPARVWVRRSPPVALGLVRAPDGAWTSAQRDPVTGAPVYTRDDIEQLHRRLRRRR
jgi:phage terminase large subunit-like protein